MGAGCRSLLIGTLALTLAAASAAPLAAQEFREPFIAGMRAVRFEKWSEAEAQMRRALAAKREDSGESVRSYAMNFERYLPNYYLGLALARQGRCAEAVPALDASERAGAIRSLPEYETLRSLRSSCQSQIAAAAPTAAPAGTSAPPRPTLAPPTATAVVAAATAPPTPVGERRRTPTPVAAEVLAPPTPAAPPAREPPALLRLAVDAFLAGQLDQLEGLLANMGGRGLAGDARAHALLLRAAGRYGRYLRGGASDAALVTAAERDLRECRALLPALKPRPRFFSPRFLRLFERLSGGA